MKGHWQSGSDKRRLQAAIITRSYHEGKRDDALTNAAFAAPAAIGHAAAMELTPDRLPPGSPCTNCGRCCTNPNYMLTLSATGEDVKRWRRQRRYDILRFAWVLGPPNNPHADLWVDSEGNERSRCPFVRKVRDQPRYLCSIYDTRPQVCRDYEPWTPDSICEIVRE